MTISVLLPVFNGEKFLSKSIDSILSQTYKDFELIIWDDSSKDGSAEIITSYHDSRIRVFKNITNQGLFKTLNLAISQAKGEWIRLWSQDDIMKLNCLKTEIEFHRQHPEIGMSYCARDIIDDLGKVIMVAPEDKTPDIVSPELATQIMFYYGSIAGNISTVAIKKSVFDNIGLFREDTQAAGDFDMWVRISSKYPIGFIHKPLTLLRCHRYQFSRWRGMGLVFIIEEREVYQSLLERLPPEIEVYAKVYNRWHRHVKYLHYMMRCLLSGDFQTAAKVYKEIQEIDNIFLLIPLWFITANGRWFKKPKFFGINP